MYRQGDVLVIPVGKMPAKLTRMECEHGRVVLAHGEATGHGHAIRSKRATLFRDEKLAAMFLSVAGTEPVALEHDEHDTMLLPPGTYQVVRQVEYTPAAIRQVAD